MSLILCHSDVGPAREGANDCSLSHLSMFQKLRPKSGTVSPKKKGQWPHFYPFLQGTSPTSAPCSSSTFFDPRLQGSSDTGEWNRGHRSTCCHILRFDAEDPGILIFGDFCESEIPPFVKIPWDAASDVIECEGREDFPLICRQDPCLPTTIPRSHGFVATVGINRGLATGHLVTMLPPSFNVHIFSVCLFPNLLV